MRNHRKIIYVICGLIVLVLLAVGAGFSYEHLNNDKVCHEDDNCITLSNNRFTYHPRYVV